MLRTYFVLIAVTASLTLGGMMARAQDAGALLDLLVKKKLITDHGSRRSARRIDARGGGDRGRQMENLRAD
jgi:1,6-anhydro-N-acetylmuramate kinase